MSNVIKSRQYLSLIFKVLFKGVFGSFQCKINKRKKQNDDQQSKTANLLNPNAIFISL